MSFNLRNRSLLTVQDYTPREFRFLLDLARDLRRAKYARTEQKHLAGKSICLIFEKTSTRTRCAFEVACFDQGAHVTYLDPSGSQLGHKESFADTGRVLGRDRGGHVAAVGVPEQNRSLQPAQLHQPLGEGRDPGGRPRPRGGAATEPRHVEGEDRVALGQALGQRPEASDRDAEAVEHQDPLAADAVRGGQLTAMDHLPVHRRPGPHVARVRVGEHLVRYRAIGAGPPVCPASSFTSEAHSSLPVRLSKAMSVPRVVEPTSTSSRSPWTSGLEV